MNLIARIFLASGFAVSCLVPLALGDDFGLPKLIVSTATSIAPSIDGVIEESVWQKVKPIEFDLQMLRPSMEVVESRPCVLQVMNSANGVYFAIQVSDLTNDASIAPLRFDLAIVSFCQGANVAAGDDRKVVTPINYVDKHVEAPGKDADDKQQDGKGAMRYDASKKTYSIEFFVPLHANDPQDLRAKPGDSFRFNIAFIDAFQSDMKDTLIGTAYPDGLDIATNWGKL